MQRVVAVLIGAVLLAACGSDGKSTATTTTSTTVEPVENVGTRAGNAALSYCLVGFTAVEAMADARANGFTADELAQLEVFLRGFEGVDCG